MAEPLVDPHEYRRQVFAWAESIGLKQIRLSIYQPRRGEHDESPSREWTCTLGELEDFAEELHRAADRVRVAESQHKHMPFAQWWPIYLHKDPNEDDCAWCRAKAVCPSQQAKLQQAASMDFGPVAETGKTPDPKAYTLLDLNEAMKIVPLLEDWSKAVRAEVERRLLQGVEFADFGLELGRQGNREFTDPAAVEDLLAKVFRLSHKDIYQYKLRTVAELERTLTKPADGKETPVLGKNRWAKVLAYVTRADPKPSVKPKAVIKKPYTPSQPSIAGFDAVPEEDLS